MPPRANVDDEIVMALIRGNGDEEIADFGVVQCWGYRVFKMKRVPLHGFLPANDDFVFLRVATVRPRAGAADIKPRGKRRNIAQDSGKLAPGCPSAKAVGDRGCVYEMSKSR